MQFPEKLSLNVFFHIWTGYIIDVGPWFDQSGPYGF